MMQLSLINKQESLKVAIDSDSLIAVRCAVEEPEIDLACLLSDKFSALIYAVNKKKFEISKYLIRKYQELGIDVNTLDHVTGRTALFWAKHQLSNELLSAWSKRNYDVFCLSEVEKIEIASKKLRPGPGYNRDVIQFAFRLSKHINCEVSPWAEHLDIMNALIDAGAIPSAEYQLPMKDLRERKIVLINHEMRLASDASSAVFGPEGGEALLLEVVFSIVAQQSELLRDRMA